ncbi:MAG: SDR family oxidoreductase [Candidatus Kapabacteria bacterium]|nr:SDR family oxidoreductase [Candidatus Kapabacteria bacterium]
MEIFSLKGKVAIVTGATGLIGRYHCKALSEAGANVVATDVDIEKCIELSETLPTKSIGIACDITQKSELYSLLSDTISMFGKVDILVNNAAINDMMENPLNSLDESKFENYSLEFFRKIVDVNVTGMFLTSQVIGSEMAENKSGSIINIASTYGIVAPDQSLYLDKEGIRKMYKSPAYPTTKGAVISFTKYLAAYWGKCGVRVNALSPGGVENSQDEFFIQKYSERTPLGRMAQPDEYMGGLVFLASEASSYMTGANLIIDGGWTIW